MAKEPAAAAKISRKGKMVWIGLIIFIAGWMFVLGILVGRGMAPVNLGTGKLEKELAELKAAMMKKEQAKIDAQTSGKGVHKPQLGFYEALKKSNNEPPFKAKLPPKPEPIPILEKPASVSAPKPLPVPAPKPAPVSKPKPAPVLKQASDPRPKIKPAPGKERFTIQVAAVKTAGNAGRLVSTLRKKGYQAYQVRSEVAGKGVWYRVRVGAFESRHAAQKTLKKLKNDKTNGMVIRTP